MTKLLNQSDLLPRSEPALELHSRAASSVGAMYRSSCLNTGSNSEGGRILKNKKKKLGLLVKCISAIGRYIRFQRM